MNAPNPHAESDPRFPSGKWTGFFTYTGRTEKYDMELVLDFAQGKMIGTGRDRVGAFTIDGAYQLSDGLCVFIKQYVGRHSVGYRGFNEGKGIWGAWELTMQGIKATGGFHIWPEGIADPSQPTLEEEAELPGGVELEELQPVGV